MGGNARVWRAERQALKVADVDVGLDRLGDGDGGRIADLAEIDADDEHTYADIQLFAWNRRFLS